MIAYMTLLLLVIVSPIFSIVLVSLFSAYPQWGKYLLLSTAYVVRLLPRLIMIAMVAQQHVRSKRHGRKFLIRTFLVMLPILIVLVIFSILVSITRPRRHAAHKKAYPWTKVQIALLVIIHYIYSFIIIDGISVFPYVNYYTGRP